MDTGLTFGPWLKRRRKELDFTQQQLALTVGCSVIALKKLEGDDLVPSKQLALLLATALAVPDGEQEAFARWSRTPLATAQATAFRAAPHRVEMSDLRRPVAPFSNLPAPLTGVIGREREIVAVSTLLRKPHIRLLTLVGPPGTGKTRLSLQVASQLAAEFEDGVRWVPLAAINTSGLIIGAIAQALGLREQPGQTLQSTVLAGLRSKQLLLVLDNFEQIVAGADVIAELLQSAPQVKALATSREALHIYGEQQFPVPPLDVPDLRHLPPVEAVGLYPAVELFVERVQAMQPTFELDESNVAAIAGICVWLDGLPLAIEMAAARIRWSTPLIVLQQLSQRLQVLVGGPRDLTPRQQTLRGAIDWSYDLLPPLEQQLFRQLAVFVDGCSEAAFLAVCGAEDVLPQPWAVATQDRDLLPFPDPRLTTLHTLIDKSLVRQAWLRPHDPSAEVRFTMLLTIHEYAGDKLRANGEAEALERRHAQYYLALAQQAEPELAGADQARWLDRLEAEHNNLRAALDWSERVPEGPELGLELASALHMFWQVRGYFREGCERLERALARTTTLLTAARAKALFVSGMLSLFQGTYEAAGNCFTEGLAIRRALDDPWGISLMLNGLGRVAEYEGRFSTALAQYEEALAIRRQLDHRWGIGGCLNNLGRATLRQGDHRAAKPLFEEGLLIFRSTGDTSTIAMLLSNLALVALREQDYMAAATLIRESLNLQIEIGYKWGIPYLLAYIAEIVCHRNATGNAIREAVHLLGAADSMHTTIGTHMDPFDRADWERCLASVQQLLAPDAFQTAWDEGRALAPDEAMALAHRELDATL